MTSSEEVIGALRGKILAKSCLEPWTPYKADLSMQGIKVLIDFPRPDSTGKDNFYEDTMLLLQMVRDKREKENRQKKKKENETPPGSRNTSNGFGTEEEKCHM